MYRYRGIIAQVMLLFIVVPIIMLLVQWIPGSEDFMSDLFFNVLGDFKIFNAAAEAMNSLVGYDRPSAERVLHAIIDTLTSSFTETFILGLCVMVVKELASTVFTNRRGYSYVRSIFLDDHTLIAAVIGFAIGLVLVRYLGMVVEQTIRLLFSAGIAIGLMLLGIGIMIRHKGIPGGRLVSRAFGRLVDVALGALLASCIALTVTAFMKIAPAMKAADAYAAVGWYMLMVAFALMIVLVMNITKRITG